MLYDIIWYESIEYVKDRSIAAEFPIEFNWQVWVLHVHFSIENVEANWLKGEGGWGSGEMGKNGLATLPPNESETWLYIFCQFIFHQTLK